MNLSYSELKDRYDKIFNKVVSSKHSRQLQLIQNEIDILELIILY